MDQFWGAVIRPLLERGQPQSVLDVGPGRSALMGRILERLADGGVGTLHAVAPKSDFDAESWSSEYGKRLRVHEGDSAEQIEGIPDVDLAILAEEPNWFTTFHQLKALERRSLQDGRPFPVVVIDNVRWPYGRRDMYPDPERIPAEFRQPHEQRGVVPGNSKLVADGMFADRHHAVFEHGPRNGVRTAVDDFIADSYRRWQFIDLPGLSGIGILVSSERLAAQPELADVLTRFTTAEFLADHIKQVELARIDAAEQSRRAISESERLGERSRHAEAELREQTRRHKHLLDEHQAFQTRIAELERLQQESAAEHGRLAQQLAELERASGTLLEERGALAERMSWLQDLLTDRDAELGRLRAIAERDSTELTRASRELDRALAAAGAAETRAVELEQARLSSERDSGRIRRALERAEIALKAELEVTGQRAGALENERDRLRTQLEAAETREAHRVADTEQAIASLRSQRDALASELDSARTGVADVEATLALTREQLAAERGAREDALALARRIGETRSWRLGHGLFTMLRRITFRRSRGTSAVTHLINRLETPALGQSEEEQGEPTEAGGGQRTNGA